MTELIKRVVCVLVACWLLPMSAVFAQGTDTPVPVAPTPYWFLIGTTQKHDTCASACSAGFAAMSASSQGYYHSASCQGSGASAYCKTTNNNYEIPTQVKYLCPGDIPPNSSNQCPPPDCKAGSTGTGTWDITFNAATGVSTGPPIKGGTDGACQINITNAQECRERANGSMYCIYDYTRTGKYQPPGPTTPTPTPSPSTTPGGAGGTRTKTPPMSSPDGSCPGGTTQAGSDSSGIPICMGMGTNSNTTPTPTVTESPPVTTSNADGSTVTKSYVTQTNSDGSRTTKTTTVTTDAAGNKTTAVSMETTKATDGGTGKTDNPEAEKNDLCKQNPNLNICRDSSVSGSCGEIACVGDAIQCATLRAAAAMECRDKKDRDLLDKSPLKGLGEAAAAGNDPMKADFPSADKASVVSVASSLDASGFLGGGSCFPDKSITVMGKSFVLSFSAACDALLVFRYALMVIAALVSFRIVSGAVLS